MPKTTTDPRQQKAEIPTRLHYVFQNTLALRNLIPQLQAPLLNLAIGAGPGGSDAWSVGNYLQNILPNISDRLPNALAALAYLESTPEFKEAEAHIVPILKAVAEVEAAEAEAAQALAAKRQAHADALAAAEARALAAAKNDPAVVAAAKALDAK